MLRSTNFLSSFKFCQLRGFNFVLLDKEILDKSNSKIKLFSQFFQIFPTENDFFQLTKVSKRKLLHTLIPP